MSDDRVVQFPGADAKRVGLSPRERLIDPKAVAEGLVPMLPKLDQLILIGLTHDNQLYAASTHPDTADNVLLLERLKRKLLQAYGDDEFA